MFWDHGVVVKTPTATVCMDPTTSNIPYKHILVSHAHSDHVAGFSTPQARKYTHESTAAIFKNLSGTTPKGNRSFRYGDSIEIGDVEVATHNSGHILGSTMFHLTTPTGTVAYTGDLNCVDTLVSKAAEPLECDTLIIESTYGSPDLVLPPRHQTYKRMVEWTLRQLREGFTPAFNVYSAGKAQEIIKMLNDFTEVPIVADGRILKVNKVYERSRIPLKADGQLESANHNNDDGVVLVSAWRSRSPVMDGRIKPAVATGWAVKFNYKCASFPLSSHADFRQLLAYVKAVKPKKVYTCLGFSEELASAIRRRLGIDASTIPRLNQTTLTEHRR